MKKIRKGIILGIFAVMMLAFTGCGKTTIKLNKYITISASGYDSMGTATYEFDNDAFMKDFKGKIKVSKNTDLGLFGGIAEEVFLYDCVNQKLDKTTGLSNGDVVTLKWDCNNAEAESAFNVKLVYSNITYTVKELTEVEKFNPFDYIDVFFRGVSPNGTVGADIDYDKPEMQYVDLATESNGGLKNGDKVTIKASITGSIDAFVEKFGVVPSKTEETYTVSGLAHYITDISEISDEMYNKMDKQLQDNFNAHVANHWEAYEKLDSLMLVGNYVLTLKDDIYINPHNYLYYVYKVTYSNNDIQNYEYYWYGYYENIIILEDGTCSIDLNEYTVSESSYSSWTGASGDYLSPEGTTCYVAGFADLDTFRNKQIISKIDRYEYKQTIR